jgi:hypothetical protein
MVQAVQKVQTVQAVGSLFGRSLAYAIVSARMILIRLSFFEGFGMFSGGL